MVFGILFIPYELYLKNSTLQRTKDQSIDYVLCSSPSLEILMSLSIVWLISLMWAAGSWRRLYQAFHSIYDAVSANGLWCTLLLLAQDIADAFANPSITRVCTVLPAAVKNATCSQVGCKPLHCVVSLLNSQQKHWLFFFFQVHHLYHTFCKPILTQILFAVSPLW